MRVAKQTNENGKEEITIVLTPDDAGLLQSVAHQFAEYIANCKQHRVKMRRLIMLIDKKLPADPEAVRGEK